MKSALGDSFDVVCRYWQVIVAIGVGQTLGANGIWKFLSAPVLIVTVAVTIIVYGRITAHFVPGGDTGNRTILRENGLNYLIVVVITGTPALVFRLFAAKLLPSPVPYVGLVTVVSAAVAVLTIYALPIVFIRKTSVAAVLAGVVFLSRNLAASAWVAGIVIVAHVLSTTGALVFRTQMSPGSFALVMGTAVSATFLLFLSFAAALRVLLAGTRQVSGNNS